MTPADVKPSALEDDGPVKNPENATNPRVSRTCSVPVRCNGEGGIRTRGAPKGTPVFETGSISHSDTSPGYCTINDFCRCASSATLPNCGLLIVYRRKNGFARRSGTQVVSRTDEPRGPPVCRKDGAILVMPSGMVSRRTSLRLALVECIEYFTCKQEMDGIALSQMKGTEPLWTKAPYFK